ncbi:hypothetical protein E4U40_006663, partial [Claviceps sp. LM458 group G5]
MAEAEAEVAIAMSPAARPESRWMTPTCIAILITIFGTHRSRRLREQIKMLKLAMMAVEDTAQRCMG